MPDSQAASLALRCERLATPIGELMILLDEHGRLRGVDWSDHAERLRTLLRRQYRPVVVTTVDSAPRSAATRALRRYFAGDLAAIDDLPVATGGTPFQRSVWQALRRVAAGATITYRDLATRAGKPDAIRAAGFANGQNPISIVLPCHRVIGSDGSLTGYGGGLARKRWLLRHEGALAR